MFSKHLVYILESERNGRLYIGCTDNLEQRIKDHNAGKVTSTKGYIPYRLVHYEEFGNKTIARKRELFFKTGKGRRVIKNIISDGEVA